MLFRSAAVANPETIVTGVEITRAQGQAHRKSGNIWQSVQTCWYRRVTNTIKLYAKQRRLVQMVSDQIRARENVTLFFQCGSFDVWRKLRELRSATLGMESRKANIMQYFQLMERNGLRHPTILQLTKHLR